MQAINQIVLSRTASDRCPIVLESNAIKWGPVPFKFENMWLQHHQFNQCIGDWWNGMQFTGHEGYNFMFRIGKVKKKLKNQNKVVFGNKEKQKKLIEGQIIETDKQAGLMDETLFNERKQIKSRLQKLIFQEGDKVEAKG